jgi:hypothetical protein
MPQTPAGEPISMITAVRYWINKKSGQPYYRLLALKIYSRISDSIQNPL